jgi:CHAT domain
MANTIPEYVAKISEAIITVEQRRQLLADLRAELEPLARTRLIVVDGEVLQLNRLQQLLDTVLAEIDALRAAKELNEADEHMEKINDALSDVRWELVDSIKEVLRKKTEQQQEIIRQQREIIQKYAARLSEWPPLMTALKVELDKAAREQAPVREEQLEIGRLDGLVSTIQRDLEEGRHAALQEQLDHLEASRTKVTEWLKSIPEVTRETIKFKRQADLLLLQSPLDPRRNLYRYTVLMRTASGSGAHGINIQEKCDLGKLDREEMASIIDEITNAVNRGVTRNFQIRKSSAPVDVAPPPAATGDNGNVASTPTSVPAAAGTPAEGVAAPAGSAPAPPSAPAPVADETLRQAVLKMPADSPLGPLYPEGLNELVNKVGDFMYRIFMSHQLQDYLNASPCSLTITTNDLMLPWELMSYQDRNEPEVDKFLCLERPIARMPMGRYFPRHHREHPDDALSFLLVYADPKKNLSAAKREVDKIETKLKETWGTQVQIVKLSEAQVTGRAMNKVLREGNFKVIHFAGHAFFDKDDADLSGLLLHNEEQFLAQKVQRLLEGRPLVFLNACESASTANEEEPQQIGEYMQGNAEGLASAFIYGGARGCVGSLWPIYDEPAADFAVHFYNNVVRGYMIGEALRLARRKIKEDYNDQITWAAYVLYGDPTLRL